MPDYSGAGSTAKILAVVEDEPDVRLLIRVTFAADPRFEIEAEADSAEEAIKLAKELSPGLIVLDHLLKGELTGFDAAPLLKEASPGSKIILFTAHEHLRGPAKSSPAIDAFLLKTNFERLLPLAQELMSLPRLD